MKVLLSAVVMMLFAAGAARAEEGARPCKADIEKFCKDVKPGGGRIIDCLKAHESELAADCKIKNMQLKGRGGAEGKGGAGGKDAKGEPCRADMDKFCKDAKPGEKMGCMKEHEKDFSEACKARIAERKQGAEKQHPCAAEIEKLCPGMKPGDGKFAACVTEHQKDLSQTCQAHFAKHKEEMARKNPCMADTEKFCKDVKPGEGRIIACLKTHEAELSDTCKARQAGGKGRGPGMEQGKPGDKPEPGNEPKPEEGHAGN